jgi:hypothetical protein
MIPNKIHFVWIGCHMPEWARHNMECFKKLNPDHEVIVHGEDAVADLDPALRAEVNKCEHLCSIADIVRYDVLNKQGGWAIDLDFFPFRPLSDCVSAWGLNESDRVFVSKIQHHKSGERLPLANGVMCCHPGSHGIVAIIQEVKRATYEGRCTYGPVLLHRVQQSRPDLFSLGEPGWFFPFDIGGIVQTYRQLLSRGRSGAVFPQKGTGGQIPIAAHLWASAADLSSSWATRNNPTRIALVKRSCIDIGLYQNIQKGLTALGFCVESLEGHMGSARPDLVVGWNGERNRSWRDKSLSQGVPTFVVEHGFLDRANRVQFDHIGNLHRSSWADSVRDPAPSGSAELLREVAESVASQGKRDGYILALGQITGDTQMMESEIDGPAPLQQIVSRSVPQSVPSYFRPHPQASNVISCHDKMPRLPGAGPEVDDYVREKHGSGLCDALSGCRFAVTINSNAITECLIAGVPVLAFGPSLAINAGVVHPTTRATFRSDLQKMLDGWHPSDSDVLNYLQWLASRQWRIDDLRNPDVLRPILQRGGVQI